MCKRHALRIAWTIARSIAFLDFRVLRWKFTYDWKCVNTTYCVPLFMPTACFPEGPSPPFTFCSFWRRRQRLEAVKGWPSLQRGHPVNVPIQRTRPPDKSAYWKITFFISHPKHVLCFGYSKEPSHCPTTELPDAFCSWDVSKMF